MYPPSTEEMANGLAKCVLDIEIYTPYNSFEPIISLLRCMCVRWQPALYRYLHSRKMAKMTKNNSKYSCTLPSSAEKYTNM